MHSPVKPRLTFLISIALLLLAGAALAPGASAGGPAVEPGDVNCGGSANSIDAVLILQFEAALKDSFACPDAAEVDGDGVVNSIDARLVLEFDAGLQDSLVRMFLAVTEPEGLCDVQAKPTSCDIPAGSSFRLAVVLHGAPLEGYIAIQTQVFIDRLRYEPTDLPADEIVWPESLLPVRFIQDEGAMASYVAHGSLSNVIPPFFPTSYQGTLVELDMACPPTSSTHDVSLLAYDLPLNPLGSSISLLTDLETVSALTIGLRDLDLLGYGVSGPVPVAHTLEINCV